MNDSLQTLLEYFKFQNGLKTVYRSNGLSDGRKESSAEHSWSVAMMTWLLTDPLEKEFNTTLDQARLLKMALIHDLVEIEAGDVAAWDKQGRKAVAQSEQDAILSIRDRFAHIGGQEIFDLWQEHDQLRTLESKLVKACDQLCPLIYRLVFNDAYNGVGMNKEKLDGIFLPLVRFSKTTSDLYTQIRSELEENRILDPA